jgi:hypothetical protein
MCDVRAMLDRAEVFERRLAEAIQGYRPEAQFDQRQVSALAFVRIVFAHGEGFRVLLNADNGISALALVRPLFEAALRGWWVAFAATDGWIATLTASANDPFLPEPAFPRNPAMLDQLDASPQLAAIEARGVPTSLRNLSDQAIRFLHSLTHGGRQPVVHALVGHEHGLLTWVIRTASSLCYIGAQLYSAAANRPDLSVELMAIRGEFGDCLHPDNPADTQDQTVLPAAGSNPTAYDPH